MNSEEMLFATFIGRRVLIRTYAAGVFCAVLRAFDMANSAALLADSYRLWRWKGDRLSLSAVAMAGGRDLDRIDVGIPLHGVPQVIEIIPVADEVVQSLTTPRNHA